MNCSIALIGNFCQAPFDLEGMLSHFIVPILFVTRRSFCGLLEKLPGFSGETWVYLLHCSPGDDTFCTNSFYCFQGADTVYMSERQYCKTRFGFVSTALAGAGTVAPIHPFKSITCLRARGFGGAYMDPLTL